MEEISTNTLQKSRKDKYHLIRVPKGFDISKLDGVECNPNQMLEIEAGKMKDGMFTVFELGPFDRQEIDLNLLVNSGGTTVAGPCLSQSLCVNKTFRPDSVSLPPAELLEMASSSPVKFPEGLKQRFIPFGSNDAVKCGKKKKKKSKKKRSRGSSDECSGSPSKKRSKH